jgi:deoxyribodipyrimidine photo-lyase
MVETTNNMPEGLRELVSDARVTVRRTGGPVRGGRCVLYWMQRSQRGWDNAALDVAVRVGNELGLPVVAGFAAASNFPGANLRSFAFLNQGLPEIQEELADRGAGFVLRRSPEVSVEKLAAELGAAMVVGDENPLRGPERWRRMVAERLDVPFWTVDADVVVPSKLIEKAQYGAYTIRPRLQRLLPEYLHPLENLRTAVEWKRPKGLTSEDPRADITVGWERLDRSVRPVDTWRGGPRSARERMKHFVERILPTYERDHNRPELDGSSRLSPYLHFGHIGPVTVAQAVNEAVRKRPELSAARDSFFNEMIVWRELAVNFVRTCPTYDTLECAESWSRKTIAEHARDEREHLYSLEHLERAETHDELWNAAQRQMLHFGWMHNYVRMYWAKKILEWSPDVATAMGRAIYLNDKYFLDGRDPNGYAGVAWAIAGKFDRAWTERPIFGKIRYMSGASTGRKFDSKEYIRQMAALAGTAEGDGQQPLLLS